MPLPSDLKTRALTAGGLILCFWALYHWPLVGVIGWILVTIEILVWEWPQLHLWWLTPVYPLTPLLMLVDLTVRGKQQLILLTVVLSALVDTGGYFGGSLWGKHKLAPHISPKKTWEGVIAGLVTVVACGPFLIRYITPNAHFSPLFIFFFLVGYTFLAVAGDLLVSYFKRRVHIKDTGSLLPGHGGLLDRLDSILLPLLFVYSLHYYFTA